MLEGIFIHSLVWEEEGKPQRRDRAVRHKRRRGATRDNNVKDTFRLGGDGAVAFADQATAVQETVALPSCDSLRTTSTNGVPDRARVGCRTGRATPKSGNDGCSAFLRSRQTRFLISEPAV